MSELYQALIQHGWTLERVPMSEEMHACRICHSFLEASEWAWISPGYFFYHQDCVRKSDNAMNVVKKFERRKKPR